MPELSSFFMVVDQTQPSSPSPFYQQQGTLPLYRLYQASSGLHLSSTSASEGTQAGYSLEGVTVYVCPL